MSIQFHVAERRDVKALVMLAGLSGSGKTYSAILMARGLIGPQGKIGFIDTEAGRGSHYAHLAGGYQIAELAPPFTPQRYIEAIDAAETAGFDALIIDSISHEWEGEGGCVEMAEQMEIKTGKTGLFCWNKPKSQHKKLVNRLLRSRMHIIFCARAREKSVQRGKGRDAEIVSIGIQPIVEKNFPFEMLISAVMDDETKEPILKKCPAELLPAFPKGEKISEKTGETIAEWLSGGVAVDEAFQETARAGREVAQNGLAALQEWWKSLDGSEQMACKALLDGELKSIARAADDLARDIREARGDGVDTRTSRTAPKPVSHDPMTAEAGPGVPFSETEPEQTALDAG